MVLLNVSLAAQGRSSSFTPVGARAERRAGAPNAAASIACVRWLRPRCPRCSVWQGGALPALSSLSSQTWQSTTRSAQACCTTCCIRRQDMCAGKCCIFSSFSHSGTPLYADVEQCGCPHAASSSAQRFPGAPWCKACGMRTCNRRPFKTTALTWSSVARWASCLDAGISLHAGAEPMLSAVPTLAG